MTSYHIFGAANERDPRFTDGQAWGGNAFAIYSITCFLVAFLLPPLARATSRKIVHVVSLLCGALGLLSVYFIQDKGILLLSMVGVGIAWASILSMPYAILSGALPAARMGVYMGIFNFFIVIPEIIASFCFGPVIRAVFGRDNPDAPMYVVMAGVFSWRSRLSASCWFRTLRIRMFRRKQSLKRISMNCSRFQSRCSPCRVRD